ncbi:23678_t:CDS:2, partial [Gigaspora rosea]
FNSHYLCLDLRTQGSFNFTIPSKAQPCKAKKALNLSPVQFYLPGQSLYNKVYSHKEAKQNPVRKK